MKSLRQYGVIVVVSVIAALSLVEMYLGSKATSELTLPFYNRLYPYVMFRPHESATYISPEPHQMSRNRKVVTHHTNVNGFRVSSPDYSIPKQKPQGQLRVAFLGGSAVQLGSTFEDTLPGSLKRFLQDTYPGREIEVINAGIQSCVSRQAIAHLLFTVVDYQPDIVILYDGVNDLGLPLTYESRPNFPYNFHVAEQSWEQWRRDRRAPLFDLVLDRSYLYRALRSRFAGDDDALTDPVTGRRLGPTAIPAEKVIQDRAFVEEHVAEYLSNWMKLVDLSDVYGFRPVCVLQPTGGLHHRYALDLTMESFHLDEKTARLWIEAFTALYEEADRQIERLSAAHSDAVFLNLRSYLQPPEEHYWDLVHVYDETNMLLAERIHEDIRQWIARQN